MKREVPSLILMGDVCLCEYMSHGHCGIVKAGTAPNSLGAAAAAPLLKEAVIPSASVRTRDYEIDNDASSNSWRALRSRSPAPVSISSRPLT